jgi:hypothetical protein
LHRFRPSSDDAISNSFMPKKRRDAHGFFQPDNINNGLLISPSTLLPQPVAEAFRFKCSAGLP